MNAFLIDDPALDFASRVCDSFQWYSCVESISCLAVVEDTRTIEMILRSNFDVGSFMVRSVDGTHSTRGTLLPFRLSRSCHRSLSASATKSYTH